MVLKLNPVGLHYVQSRLDSLSELESLLSGAPVDYLRAYVSDLGDHRALEHLRRILRLLTCLKVVSVLPWPARDPTRVGLEGFGRLKVLELRGCDLSTSAARGLLELRHTLEKLVCHNSTDALRHIFASRIAEIKDSPVWNRLSFVSCALNGLLLMDESLQLLPVVETLDLSRNKFAKVDNLRKCTRLKHLDLGFNQLRTVTSFTEVSCHLVKLVLRNNALTTLCGLENLKCLEGLDLSCNLISNLSELEILAGFPSLSCLWLEGNPICCARWYRSQVFSIFLYPDKLTLDGNKITTREFWRVHIITASRHKQPASFGFYFPAKGDRRLEGTMNTRRNRHSRLACIEGEEPGMHTNSDEDSVACENESHSKGEDFISDEETEIINLVERIEKMKKERANLWLQEFKEWLIQDPKNCPSTEISQTLDLNADKNNQKSDNRQSYIGESSLYVSNAQGSGEESTANKYKSDGFLADHSFVVNSHNYHGRINEILNFSVGDTYKSLEPAVGCTDDKQEQVKSHTEEDYTYGRANNNQPDLISVPRGESKPRQPPQYQKDILHRHHNMVEENLQLSDESFSVVASSDSNTSCSEDDFSEYGPSIPDSDLAIIEELSERSSYSTIRHSEGKQYQRRNGVAQNGLHISDSNAEPTLSLIRFESHHNLCIQEYEYDAALSMNRVDDWLGKKNSNRKPPSRLVVLVEEIDRIVVNIIPELSLNGDRNFCINKIKDRQQKPSHRGRETNCKEITPSIDGPRSFPGSKATSLDAEKFLEHYFNTKFADKGVGETCRKCITCFCIIQQTSGCKEGEVALLLSNDYKLYVMLIDRNYDGPGISSSLMGCHRIEDVKLVLVGLGLQFLRVYIGNGRTYVLITRSVHKARRLLSLLHCLDSEMRKHNCCTKSLEQVQVELFHRDICGCLELRMFQYAMVLFWCSDMKESTWLSRSLFVLEQHLLVCTEDLMECGSPSVLMSPYFALHSRCSIADVSGMVMDTTKGWIITLTIENATNEFCGLRKMESKAKASRHIEWKLKWFSENSLLNFVALMKAIHAGAANSFSFPLSVTCES